MAGGDEAGLSPVRGAHEPGPVVRRVADEEFAAYVSCVGTAFGRHLSPAWEARVRLDIGDRAIATFEGDHIVGTNGWFPLELTVPGGIQVPVAYLVAVTVLPTHRRRGLMAAMLRRTADDIRAAGHPLAVLSASEAGIYGRFGFGVATSRCHYELDKQVARLAGGIAPATGGGGAGGSVRLIDAAEAFEVAPVLWERSRLESVGEVSLPPSFWDSHFGRDDPEEPEDKRRFFAVFEQAGVTEGWVEYKFEVDPTGGDRHAVEVGLLVTASREAYTALMAYLLGIDLAVVLRFHHRDLDEPLRQMLADPRQLRVVTYDDDTWIRPMDVRAALTSRKYAPGTSSLSLLVHDHLCPWNEGGYRLEVDATGAAAVEGPVSLPGTADLELDVAALGSALLGGHRWSSLVRAGRVVERVDGAAWRADAAFASDRPPFATISL